jgi:hypothetical protein
VPYTAHFQAKSLAGPADAQRLYELLVYSRQPGPKAGRLKLANCGRHILLCLSPLGSEVSGSSQYCEAACQLLQCSASASMSAKKNTGLALGANCYQQQGRCHTKLATGFVTCRPWLDNLMRNPHCPKSPGVTVHTSPSHTHAGGLVGTRLTARHAPGRPPMLPATHQIASTRSQL